MVRRVVLVPSYGATKDDVWVDGAYMTPVYMCCPEYLQALPGDQLLELALMGDPDVMITKGESDEQADKMESPPT